MFETFKARPGAWAFYRLLLIFGLCACGGSKEGSEQRPEHADGQSSAGDEHATPSEQRGPAEHEDKRDPRDIVPAVPIAPP